MPRAFTAAASWTATTPSSARPGAPAWAADKTNGIGQLTTLESSAKSLYRGLTIGMQKQLSKHFQFQMNYQLSEDLADDDNERDPVQLPLRRGQQLQARLRLLRPHGAAPLQRVRSVERRRGESISRR